MTGKRQAEERRKASNSQTTSDNSPTDTTTSQISEEDHGELDLPVSVCKTKDDVLVRSIDRLEEAVQRNTLKGGPRLELLSSLIKFNVYRALRENNESLRFDMTWRSEDGLSPFLRPDEFASNGTPSYPAHLAPTKLQLTITHHPWIDLLPFPAMRDNILKLGEEYDDWPLCYDILEDTSKDYSGLIVWGSPWDPNSWEVTEEFARRWTWVLRDCVELLQSTNHWRTKRGEKKLFPDQLCQR